MTKEQRAALAAGLALVAAPLEAKDKDDVPELVRCQESIGSIALVEGDQAGWTDWGLGSPPRADQCAGNGKRLFHHRQPQ